MEDALVAEAGQEGLVAVELAYRRMDQHLDEPLAGFRRPAETQITLLDTQTASDPGTAAARSR